ncbi:uncharacterized protein [Aristolochia californica]|uniref:uncharacterized protein n=1 Tax=Aristolochia californica TaxID=171875 RepID=UPI0035E0958B
MAKFTAQGNLRFSLHPDTRDPFQYRYGTNGFLENLPLQILHLNRDKPRKSCRSYRLRSAAKKKSSGSGASERCLDESDIDVVAVDGDDDEFARDELSCFRGLVLDISYRPVNVVCWRRAICLEFMEKADVLEYYDQTVASPSGSFFIPAVLRVPHLLQVAKRRRIKHNLSRKSIFFRDHYLCQYCSSGENLTIDHVLPISRGGEWKWENLVTACAKCNSKKGQKTLEESNMKLIKVPKALKDFDILAIPLTNTAIRMLRMRKGMPDEWRQYLSKSSMEP